jgi:hypothetical protein
MHPSKTTYLCTYYSINVFVFILKVVYKTEITLHTSFWVSKHQLMDL